jgi:hypothetical protein
MLRIDRGFTVFIWRRGRPDFKDQSTVDELGNLLLRADLPE